MARSRRNSPARPLRHRTIRHVLLPALYVALFGACAPAAEQDEAAADPAMNAVREELLAMGRVDQQVREGVNAATADDSVLLRRMLAVDSLHTQRLREIVAEHGWPERSVVGDDAASAAFLIVQHSPSHSFQVKMLELLRLAAERGEAKLSDVALLTDRVRTHQGEPQLYGTQFQIRAGTLIAHPIEAPHELERRRAEMGLPTMSEYIEMLRQMYGGPVQLDTVPAPDEGLP